MTPEELSEAYRLGRESVLPRADLQQYTELDPGVMPSSFWRNWNKCKRQS